jgi:hypothetical protein
MNRFVWLNLSLVPARVKSMPGSTEYRRWNLSIQATPAARELLVENRKS